jgi:hypothetical protein
LPDNPDTFIGCQRDNAYGVIEKVIFDFAAQKLSPMGLARPELAAT